MNPNPGRDNPFRSHAITLDSVIARLPDPDTTVHPPDLTEITSQISELTALAKNLTDHMRTVSGHPGDDNLLDRWTLFRALGDLLDGTERLSRATTQLAFLTDTLTRNKPDVAATRESIAQTAVRSARSPLAGSSATLHDLANRRDPARADRALASTTPPTRPSPQNATSPRLPSPRTGRTHRP